MFWYLAHETSSISIHAVPNPVPLQLAVLLSAKIWLYMQIHQRHERWCRFSRLVGSGWPASQPCGLSGAGMKLIESDRKPSGDKTSQKQQSRRSCGGKSDSLLAGAAAPRVLRCVSANDAKKTDTHTHTHPFPGREALTTASGFHVHITHYLTWLCLVRNWASGTVSLTHCKAPRGEHWAWELAVDKCESQWEYWIVCFWILFRNGRILSICCVVCKGKLMSIGFVCVFFKLVFKPLSLSGAVVRPVALQEQQGQRFYPGLSSFPPTVLRRAIQATASGCLSCCSPGCKKMTELVSVEALLLTPNSTFGTQC